MNEQALQMLQQEVLAPSTTDVPRHLSAEEQKKWEELRKRLENWHVRRDSEMLGARHLLDYDGVKLMPRGDLVAVSGKEKSGKTTFCRILSAAVLRGEYMGFRALEGNLRVLWIDTEQYEVSTRTMVRSMDVMCDRELLDDEFLTFNIRGREELSDLEDMRLVLRVFYDMYQPDIVVVDGIRDFIADFNDVMQSAEIVLQCMALSNGVTAEESQHTGLKERKPCCTLCILHQNKPKEDNNMMGHLGATLAKKAGELWNCYRDDDRIFYAEEVFGRTREMEQKTSYKIVTELYKDGEELGIPIGFEPEEPDHEPEPGNNDPTPSVPKESQIEKFLRSNDLRDAFYRLIPPDQSIQASRLCNAFMETFAIGYRSYDILRLKALEEKIIVRIQGDNRYVFYGRNE